MIHYTLNGESLSAPAAKTITAEKLLEDAGYDPQAHYLLVETNVFDTKPATLMTRIPPDGKIWLRNNLRLYARLTERDRAKTTQPPRDRCQSRGFG